MFKKYVTFGLTILLVGLLVPSLVSAHESFQFEIGGQTYEVVIGSLNEPVTVDDKSGVYFNINRVAGSPSAVTGLEEDLQVELIAGDKSRVLDMEAAHGEPGVYEASFFPTVATQLEYRVFGTINDTDFDYTFACNPDHPNKEESSEEIEVSEGVSLVQRSGSYGCPQPKAEMGFPEESSSIVNLVDQTSNLENAVSDARSSASTNKILSIGALIVGAFGLGLAMRSGKEE